MKSKSEDKKRDFIRILSSMSVTEINDYIVQHGKPPKLVIMARRIDKKTGLPIIQREKDNA